MLHSFQTYSFAACFWAFANSESPKTLNATFRIWTSSEPSVIR